MSTSSDQPADGARRHSRPHAGLDLHHFAVDGVPLCAFLDGVDLARPNDSASLTAHAKTMMARSGAAGGVPCSVQLGGKDPTKAATVARWRAQLERGLPGHAVALAAGGCRDDPWWDTDAGVAHADAGN